MSLPCFENIKANIILVFVFFVCVVFVFLFFSDTSFSTGISYRKGETRVSRSFLQRVFSISTLIMFVGQGWRSDENTHL